MKQIMLTKFYFKKIISSWKKVKKKIEIYDNVMLKILHYRDNIVHFLKEKFGFFGHEAQIKHRYITRKWLFVL